MSRKSSKRFARHMGFGDYRSLMHMSLQFGPAHYEQSWYLSFNPTLKLWFSWIEDEPEQSQIFSSSDQNAAALKILGWAIQHYLNLFQVGRERIRPAIAWEKKATDKFFDIAGWKIFDTEGKLPTWESVTYPQEEDN